MAGTNPGDADYGIVEFSYDAAGRLKVRTDQKGYFVTHVYDLAGRRTAREYRSFGKQTTDPADDTDTFTFDEDGNILTAVKGRYNNRVTFTYLCPCQLEVGGFFGFSPELVPRGMVWSWARLPTNGVSFRDWSMRCSPAGRDSRGGRPSLA